MSLSQAYVTYKPQLDQQYSASRWKRHDKKHPAQISVNVTTTQLNLESRNKSGALMPEEVTSKFPGLFLQMVSARPRARCISCVHPPPTSQPPLPKRECSPGISVWAVTSNSDREVEILRGERLSLLWKRNHTEIVW